MLQFTQKEAELFRQKAQENPNILAWLKDKTKLIRENPLKIPHKGVANWGHYYYCADCSIALTYDFFKPKTHVCPSCGKTYLGEPYDGAWWRFTNGENDTACHYLGLLYLCTGDVQYAQRAKEILMGYATYYPEYEVHGDIPYNGPGKANAQTLCESVFLRTLAYGYDLISDTLTEEERNFIQKNLLECGAAFLVQNRHCQIHNHEVITNSAIAVIGLITDNQEFIDFALYHDYGLLYQLEHGVLEDGVWFECSLGYHYYALQSFFAYEKFAQHTAHSHIQHPLYRKMFEVSLQFLLPDYTHPLINDTLPHHAPLDSHDLLEFAYRSYQSPCLLDALHHLYQDTPRTNLESFFYGVDALPPQAEAYALPDYHAEHGSGLTIVRGANEQYLMFRHSPYAGEHDHYDRLSLSYYFDKLPAAADFGTTGYGAYYHYNYFKNTGAHNTVVIDEENHAPSDCKVLAFTKDDAHTFVDAACHWVDDYQMPDSFVIKQWSDEAYRNVVMRRQIYKTDDFLIDVFHVDNVADKTIDWTFHFSGERSNLCDATTAVPEFSQKVPFMHLRNVVAVSPADTQNPLIETTYTTSAFETHVYSLLLDGTTLLYADGPSNPTSQRIEYMLQRVTGNKTRFINVIATSKPNCRAVSDVHIENSVNYVTIILTLNGKEQRITIPN